MFVVQCSIVVCHRWLRFAHFFLKCRAEGASENDKRQLNIEQRTFRVPNFPCLRHDDSRLPAEKIARWISEQLPLADLDRISIPFVPTDSLFMARGESNAGGYYFLESDLCDGRKLVHGADKSINPGARRPRTRARSAIPPESATVSDPLRD
jgi:hypothetical protein